MTRAGITQRVLMQCRVLVQVISGYWGQLYQEENLAYECTITADVTRIKQFLNVIDKLSSSEI